LNRLGPAAFAMSLLALAGIVFLFSGGYRDAIAARDGVVVIRTSLDARVRSAAASLSDEDLREIECIAENNYFEARGEGEDGMWYVTNVVLNRMKGGVFPRKACKVVSQCDPRNGVCQFSWVNDGRDHSIREHDAWNDAYEVALLSWIDRDEAPDPTGGATRYENGALTKVRWKGWRETASIGGHQFYKEPSR